MKQFETKPYTVSDFLEWYEKEQLELSPKFQRRNVWSAKAKSYLIDTIIRGKPFPKIIIRESLNPASRRVRREVVDGQQRLRTIFEYINDAFPISKAHNDDHGKKRYSQLPRSIQVSILTYPIAADTLANVPDEEVLDIFARLNTYGVKLNEMELLNAEFSGEFKTVAFELGWEFHSFWLNQTVLTEKQITRMLDAEMCADLLIALADGIQDKARIRYYFDDWDDEFRGRKRMAQRLRHTIDVIGRMFPDGLSAYEFSRQVLFYSLFCAIAHMEFGVPRLSLARAPISPGDYPKVRTRLAIVNEIWQRAGKGGSKKEAEFYQAGSRATTHQPQRLLRTRFLCDLIRK